MDPFRFVTSTAVERVQTDAAMPGAQVLAGGTTLLDLMKLGVEHPQVLVDITRLPWATVESLGDGTVRVGALVRNSEMAAHPLVRDRFPAVAQAILAGASPQLRNMATTGGNLLQRTRCAYFRDQASACNKRAPGSGCGAIDGEHRTHAVLGTSPQCIATHPSDLCVALAAFDAVVRVESSAGTRTIPFASFHLEPGAHPEQETPLAPGELITALDLPPLSFAKRSLYLKVRDRASYSFALASAAVALDVVGAGGVVRDARIALGGVGTRPWRATSAERALRGQRAGADAYRAAADRALEGAAPRAQNAFKVELAKRTIVRALVLAEALA